MRWYFGFFFVSGFCSILYELVWLRLAMAQFAVTTALVSVVLSAFMIGLGLGSWGAGRLLRGTDVLDKIPALRLYALTEFCIGISAIAVPYELSWGRAMLQKLDTSYALAPSIFYVATGIAIGVALVPWCACMGATFPFAMAAIKQGFSTESRRSFSYLYLANVLGAVMGAAFPLLLIEEFGFHRTLRVGAILNFSLAACAFALSFSRARDEKWATTDSVRASRPPVPATANRRWLHYLLFATGFTSMGAEVVWIRLFTPGLGTVVYAFAIILGLYLWATYVGSRHYRKVTPAENAPGGLLLSCLGFSVVLPLLLCDPRLPLLYPVRVFSILPFSFLVGYVTPMILDRVSLGDPDRAGKGYAINIVGCVLGPLASGFLLLPWFGERGTLLALALAWIAAGLWKAATAEDRDLRSRWLKPIMVSLGALALVFGTENFESQYSPREVRHDSTATVTAMGATRDDKQLLVNGIGMTGLTPITKMMAHLPLAAMQRKPQSGLVICFGMGTTYRSMLSWGVPATAVELVPSVVSVFPFFHSDAEQLVRSPLWRVVVDDGRFFLGRSHEQYDVIVLDPPPPVEAAASSLLYSKEFYSIAKMHLRPDGILQQWLPGSKDPAILTSVAKALQESFPYVRVFHSVEGWGEHFLASASPIALLSAADMAARLPPAAAADLMEWGPAPNAEQQFDRVLQHEISLNSLILQDPAVEALHDDRPVNEYFVLRRIHDYDYMARVWKRWKARARTMASK